MEKVAWDVRNGKVSREAALRDYLVVIREDCSIDLQATEALRARQKTQGGEL